MVFCDSSRETPGAVLMFVFSMPSSPVPSSFVSGAMGQSMYHSSAPVDILRNELLITTRGNCTMNGEVENF